MDDNFEELVIDVRATTEGFNSDLETMRGALGNSLLSGFDRAGQVLERSLLSALRRGSLGFDDLKRTAFSVLDSIAAHALQSGLNSLFGSSQGGLSGIFGQLFGGSQGGLSSLFGGSFGSLFGLPGRATGGPVAPGRGYIVGENGPELFVPTSSGRIAANGSGAGQGRDVRVAIQLNSPRGTAAPTAMQRSSRQVASAVRRALQDR